MRVRGRTLEYFERSSEDFVLAEEAEREGLPERVFFVGEEVDFFFIPLIEFPPPFFFKDLLIFFFPPFCCPPPLKAYRGEEKGEEEGAKSLGVSGLGWLEVLRK